MNDTRDDCVFMNIIIYFTEYLIFVVVFLFFLPANTAYLMRIRVVHNITQ